MNAPEILSAWHRSAARLAPGIDVWDAHTHTGTTDPDGRRLQADELVRALDNAGHAGAVVMPHANPDGYRAANDRVLAESAATGGRLLPFCRVDPRNGADAAAEAERGLDAGHRGIKLHPRAEQFAMDDPGVQLVAKVAAERSVPVLVHAGRGIPSLGEASIALLEGSPGLRLILAHCGISDLARLGPLAADYPRLYFDTSWWDVIDRLSLAAWAPPGQILYASDAPYGSPTLGFVLAMRVAAASGYDAEQVGALFGGTLHRLLSGEDGEDLGAAPEFGPIKEPGLLRVHAALHGAIFVGRTGDPAVEPLSLARLACEVSPDAPHYEVYRALASTIDAIDLAGSDARTAFSLLAISATAALTPGVPVPDLWT